jgi:palmitoyltransferase ZDHHC9/14/18
MKNLREVLFSKIPPSMHKFRSFVEEEHIMVASATPNLGEAITIISPKEKIDIEMGTKHTEGSDLKLPGILRDLDYSDLEDGMKSVEEERIATFDPVLPVEQGSKQCVQCSTDGDGVRTFIQRSSTGDGAGVSDQSSKAANGTEAFEGTDNGHNLHQTTTAPVFHA